MPKTECRFELEKHRRALSSCLSLGTFTPEMKCLLSINIYWRYIKWWHVCYSTVTDMKLTAELLSLGFRITLLLTFCFMHFARQKVISANCWIINSTGSDNQIPLFLCFISLSQMIKIVQLEFSCDSIDDC